MTNCNWVNEIKHGMSLNDVPKGCRTEAVCLAAVMMDGMALEFVENQTLRICIAAVLQNPESLKFVREQSEMVCMMALSKDYRTFQYIKEPTPLMWMVFAMQESLPKYISVGPTLITDNTNMSDWGAPLLAFEIGEIKQKARDKSGAELWDKIKHKKDNITLNI